MIFNKRTPTVLSFKIDGKQLDIVKEYRYLGINICCSGSFVPAIRELVSSASRGLYKIMSCLRNQNYEPKLLG